MQTTNIVGLIVLICGVSASIVGIGLVAREQPIAWLGVAIGVALLSVAYKLLHGAGRRLPAEKS